VRSGMTLFRSYLFFSFLIGFGGGSLSPLFSFFLICDGMGKMVWVEVRGMKGWRESELTCVRRCWLSLETDGP